MKEDGFIFLSGLILMMFFVLLVQVILPIFNNTVLYIRDYSKYESNLINENLINALLISNYSGDNINIYGIDSLPIIQNLYASPPIEYYIKLEEEDKSYQLMLIGEDYNDNLFKIKLLLLDDKDMNRSETNEKTIEFYLIKQ